GGRRAELDLVATLLGTQTGCRRKPPPNQEKFGARRNVLIDPTPPLALVSGSGVALSIRLVSPLSITRNKKGALWCTQFRAFSGAEFFEFGRGLSAAACLSSVAAKRLKGEFCQRPPELEKFG